MKPTVIILLSDKRSGSTMFQDALCRHPDIQTVDYSPHTYLETHHWLKGAVLLNPDETIYKGYGSISNARTYLIDCVQENVPEFAVPTDDRELVFKGWEALCQKFAQPVFFEKSPQHLGNSAALELLLEWMQTTQLTVKVIGLTRNPLSVQYSALQLFHTNPEERQFAWIEGQQNLLKIKQQLSNENFLHIKYEDLIHESKSTFATIFNFIGVPSAPEVGKAIHGKSLEKWKDDPYFTLRLDDSVKVLAKEFGYSDEDLNNPEKPLPPLSWRIRKRLEATYKLGRAHLKDRILKPIILRIKGHR